jgi:hypothetical protein
MYISRFNKPDQTNSSEQRIQFGGISSYRAYRRLYAIHMKKRMVERVNVKLISDGRLSRDMSVYAGYLA